VPLFPVPGFILFCFDYFRFIFSSDLTRVLAGEKVEGVGRGASLSFLQGVCFFPLGDVLYSHVLSS